MQLGEFNDIWLRLDVKVSHRACDAEGDRPEIYCLTITGVDTDETSLQTEIRTDCPLPDLLDKLNELLQLIAFIP